MKKWILLLLGLGLWTCGGFYLFDSDDKDNSAPVINLKPERIVTAAPNLTEILFALGLGNNISGVSIGSDFPPAAAKKPRIGTFWQPNTEAVISLRPALVVTLDFPQQKKLANQLSAMGYNCLTLQIESVSQFFDSVDNIGKATGKEVAADELANDIRKKLKDLSARIGTNEKLKVLWVIQRDPLRVAGTDTFINELIELAGGVNAIGKTIHKYPPIGSEQVIAIAPDIIIEPSMGTDDLVEQKKGAMKYWSRFGNIPAVALNRIYCIKGDNVSQLGPRLYEGVEIIAKCIRPEIFETTK
jgi:iron complex transport system substrate-binding protein